MWKKKKAPISKNNKNKKRIVVKVDNRTRIERWIGIDEDPDEEKRKVLETYSKKVS